MRSLLTASTLGLALMLSAGCTDKTEGERTLDRAERLEEAGETITRGEGLIVEGQATQARGEALRDQGKRLEGERLMAEGKAKRSQGGHGCGYAQSAFSGVARSRGSVLQLRGRSRE